MPLKKIRCCGNRHGLRDIWWNAFMVKDASFSEGSDIPFCPTTAKELPKSIITYSEAVTIYNKKIAHAENNFFIDSFICFYIDDYRFDGPEGIWFKPLKALNIIRHFAGIITPDFSTNVDYPDALKRWNTYRSRAFGYWCGREGIAVLNNFRWGFEETFEYCCHGIPKHDIICIGSVASGLKTLRGQELFSRYFFKGLEELEPKIILVYGGASYKVFDVVRMMGIKVIEYPSTRNRNYCFDRSCI